MHKSKILRMFVHFVHVFWSILNLFRTQKAKNDPKSRPKIDFELYMPNDVQSMSIYVAIEFV